MGYIMPVDHFQYVQYGNRVAFKEENKQAFQPIEGAKPIFPVLLQARTEEKQEEEELEIIEQQQQLIDVVDISEEKETEATVRRKQLEKMAKEKPDEIT